VPSEPATGRLPDFFIVGQPKSGTTALYEMLRRHPEIFMPASKEPWFFADELHERPPPRPEGSNTWTGAPVATASPTILTLSPVTRMASACARICP